MLPLQVPRWASSLRYAVTARAGKLHGWEIVENSEPGTRSHVVARSASQEHTEETFCAAAAGGADAISSIARSGDRRCGRGASRRAVAQRIPRNRRPRRRRSPRHRRLDAPSPPKPTAHTCWRVPPASTAIPSYWFDPSPRVPCTQPHTTESAAVLTLTEPDDRRGHRRGSVSASTTSVSTWASTRAAGSRGRSSHFLPSEKQIAGGASWLRCDVAFPAAWGSARARPVTVAADGLARTPPADFWACLDEPPSQQPQPFVACERPHAYEETGTLALLAGPPAVPVRSQARRRGSPPVPRRCTARAPPRRCDGRLGSSRSPAGGRACGPVLHVRPRQATAACSLGPGQLTGGRRGSRCAGGVICWPQLSPVTRAAQVRGWRPSVHRPPVLAIRSALAVPTAWVAVVPGISGTVSMPLSQNYSPGAPFASQATDAAERSQRGRLPFPSSVQRRCGSPWFWAPGALPLVHHANASPTTMMAATINQNTADSLQPMGPFRIRLRARVRDRPDRGCCVGSQWARRNLVGASAAAGIRGAMRASTVSSAQTSVPPRRGCRSKATVVP